MTNHLKVKQFIACAVCGKEFGGPAAGEYEDWNHQVSNLQDFLVSEALEMFWIKIQCGAAEVMVCSRACAKKWIYDDEECYANARG